MTIDARVALARQQLAEAGISAAEAAISARVLAQHVLGWDAARLVTGGGDPEPSSFAREFELLVERRCRREPVAYLTGRREFWGLDFEVSPAVLIPRPETELVIEIAGEIITDRKRQLDIADVGTGSGCLAVALAREFPAARIIATDISDDALQVARRNAARHQVEGRISFTTTDLLQGVPGPFDVIVSNPPYVRDPDRPALQPEVRDFEPHAALFGGPEGLTVIRRLLETVHARLKPHGVVLFEFGLGQADQIVELARAIPSLGDLSVREDLQGIQRVAVCRSRPAPA